VRAKGAGGKICGSGRGKTEGMMGRACGIHGEKINAFRGFGDETTKKPLARPKGRSKANVVLVHAMKRHRTCGGIAPLILNLCTRGDVSSQLHALAPLALSTYWTGSCRGA
jgi:hypothetical protein